MEDTAVYTICEEFDHSNRNMALRTRLCLVLMVLVLPSSSFLAPHRSAHRFRHVIRSEDTADNSPDPDPDPASGDMASAAAAAGGSDPIIASAASSQDSGDISSPEPDLASSADRAAAATTAGGGDPILAEMSVLQVNSAFYDSFRAMNLQKMRNLWSDSDEATCAHPGMATIFGGKKIVKSWEALFSGGSMPPIRATRQKVVLRGDIAWVTCCESTGNDPASLEAINIFERKEGRWLMIHHQAAPVLPIFQGQQRQQGGGQ